MKIYLFLAEKIIHFILPSEIVGSFGFDVNPDSDSKLINIEARDNKWVMYSTLDSFLILNNEKVDEFVLKNNTFYTISKDNINYLVYVSDVKDTTFKLYSYENILNLIIGNGKVCNVNYNCEYLKDAAAQLTYKDNKLTLIKNNSSIYVNNKALRSDVYSLIAGDEINLFGLKIFILPKFLIINNPSKNVLIDEKNTGLTLYNVLEDDINLQTVVRDVDLYSPEEYFTKMPRLRRTIEKKNFKIEPPPNFNNNDEMPMILTFGPMMTMGISSLVMLIDAINRITSGESTLKDTWTTLVMSGTMLISMLLWPLIIKLYTRRKNKKKKQKIIKKYKEYLHNKQIKLTEEINLQRTILLENLITVEECVNIIKNKKINFWEKRIDEKDFLLVRIGMGNEPVKIDLDVRTEEFSVEENELRDLVNGVVQQFKCINNVPIGYSLKNNLITAVMSADRRKSINFVNNILLQVLAFHAYEDLKIVVFTNDSNKENWEYIKYLNHNFNNEKTFRFFSTNIENSKNLSSYLNNEINSRMERLEDKNANINTPHYLIIVDDYEMIKKSNFVKTLMNGNEVLGFSMIIIENSLGKLPEKCDSFISLGINKSEILKNSYEKQEQVLFDDEIIYDINMSALAKVLANIPLEFRDSAKQMPDAISFLEMEHIGKVEQLNILNRWQTNDSTISLKTEIGVDDQGKLICLDLHEKYHGPHGLIAGTTGSGKSEFIITYILSLAVNYSPDDVSFIIIDYKGGGLALAFENRNQGISLPHLAGTITNLDKAEMDRTLVSIDSEIKRRQVLFNEVREKLGESTMDIYKYQKHYKDGLLDEPIPHLFIICDEFAELKSQQPEFMDNLISVARIGRSLGVHLILATQKPSGVVNEQIWSNTRFRVCLKVQNEADSKEMLKRPEAAHIKNPGRFYLQVGYDEIFELGQSAWCGAKYYPSDTIKKEVDKSIDFIGDCGNIIKSIKETSEIKIQAQGEQFSSIMKSVIDIAGRLNKKVKRLWLENVSPVILVEEVEKKYNIKSALYSPSAIIGEYDVPEQQKQGPVIYNYLNDGNALVYGMDSTDVEMFIDSLIYSSTKNHTSEEINFYIVDCGSETLKKYEKLPHVGGVVLLEEKDKFLNLIDILSNEYKRRKKIFVDYGGDYESYIKNSNKKLPIYAVIINDYNSLYNAIQDCNELILNLVKDCVRYGIVFILTGKSSNSIQSRITQNFNAIYSFKLNDPLEYYSLFNLRNKITIKNVDGRGIVNINGLHEFQNAYILPPEQSLNEHIINFINEQRKICKIYAKRIPVLPDIVRLEDVKQTSIDLTNLPIGILKDTLQVATINSSFDLGYTVLSKRLSNMYNFIISLITEISTIPNICLIIIDLTKTLNLDKKYYPNYYTEDAKSIITNIKKYLKSLIDSNSDIKGTILIYGFTEFIDKLESKKEFEDLVQEIEIYKKINIIIVEEEKKLKDYTFDKWYNKIINKQNGLWIGSGAGDQSILKSSGYDKRMQQKYKNDMGYLYFDGEANLVKLIDFVTLDGDETDEK